MRSTNNMHVWMMIYGFAVRLVKLFKINNETGSSFNRKKYCGKKCPRPFSTLNMAVVFSRVSILLRSVRLNYYRPQRSCGQGNIFTPVCHSVHGGVCLSACWDTTPQEQTPSLGADTPPGSDTPPRADPLEQTPPWNRPPLGADTPPREQTSPSSRHPLGADTPPPGSRLRHTVNERPVRILLECILVFGDFWSTPLEVHYILEWAELSTANRIVALYIKKTSKELIPLGSQKFIKYSSLKVSE